MAYRIDLPKNAILLALEGSRASLKRSAGKTGINPLMAKIIEDDIAQITRAIDTLTEVK